jgi:hypothetical protein
MLLERKKGREGDGKDRAGFSIKREKQTTVNDALMNQAH